MLVQTTLHELVFTSCVLSYIFYIAGNSGHQVRNPTERDTSGGGCRNCGPSPQRFLRDIHYDFDF